MSSLGEVLGWKFDHEPGIETLNGVISAWPSVLGPLPDQAQIDIWSQEYQNRDTQEEEYSGIVDNRLLKALALVCADQFGMTPAQLKTAIKSKL